MIHQIMVLVKLETKMLELLCALIYLMTIKLITSILHSRTKSTFIWHQERRENVTNELFLFFYPVLFEDMVLPMLLDSDIAIGDCFNATESIHVYCKKVNTFSWNIAHVCLITVK